MLKHTRPLPFYFSILLVLWNVFFYIPTPIVLAQDTETLTAPYPVPAITIAGIVNTAVQLVFGTAILVCVVFMVVFSIKYIVAGDDVKKITGARKGITGALIGLVIVILTFTIIKLIAILLGADPESVFSVLPTSLGLTVKSY